MFFKIGAHEILFAQIIAVQKRGALLRFLSRLQVNLSNGPGRLSRLISKLPSVKVWTIRMAQGVDVHLTNAEKFEYDGKRLAHEMTMSLLQVATQAQQTGRLNLPK